MRLGKLRNTEIECSPFVLLPILYALLAGRPGTMLLNLLALFLHELCHAFVARAMGYRIKRIELQPFGFVARIENASETDGMNLPSLLRGRCSAWFPRLPAERYGQAKACICPGARSLRSLGASTHCWALSTLFQRCRWMAAAWRNPCCAWYSRHAKPRSFSFSWEHHRSCRNCRRHFCSH